MVENPEHENLKSFEREFATVKLVMESEWPTAYTDAFSLAYIKYERQLRRLFTHTAFQASCFQESDVESLRNALSQNRDADSKTFEKGLEELLGIAIGEMLGADYKFLKKEVKKARNARNKIFHGQLTNCYLSKKDLKCLTMGIQSWCKKLSTAAQEHIGYDGFGHDMPKRSSFQKLCNMELVEKVDKHIKSIEDYKKTLKKFS